MTSLVALLRAVNVGGTGKLPMVDLKNICEQLGFGAVRTYIASGNVVFESRKSETAVKTALQKQLAAYTGKPVGVLVRSASEMAQIAADNPFPEAAPSRTMVVFLDRAPPDDTLAGVRGQNDEDIRLGRREIYIHYSQGIAKSKLVIAAAKTGTARNINTVAVLARMAAES
ncbi:DUF1697 domain-containing protein [Bradyrhizobium sp.]|uniref:DUF1697 domain-containing protein n=1 Tax=Bradyrhizobium sp. TaxID=376 RepID=UPI003C355BB3